MRPGLDLHYMDMRPTSRPDLPQHGMICQSICREHRRQEECSDAVYELLIKAEQALGRPVVMEMVQKLTTSFNDYTDDPELFEAVRVELGEALARAF